MHGFCMAFKLSGDANTRLPLLAMPHLSFKIAKTPDMGGYFIFVASWKWLKVFGSEVCVKEPGPEDPEAWDKAIKWAEEQDQLDEESEFAAVDDVGQ